MYQEIVCKVFCEKTRKRLQKKQKPKSYLIEKGWDIKYFDSIHNLYYQNDLYSFIECLICFYNGEYRYNIYRDLIKIMCTRSGKLKQVIPGFDKIMMKLSWSVNERNTVIKCIVDLLNVYVHIPSPEDYASLSYYAHEEKSFFYCGDRGSWPRCSFDYKKEILHLYESKVASTTVDLLIKTMSTSDFLHEDDKLFLKIDHYYPSQTFLLKSRKGLYLDNLSCVDKVIKYFAVILGMYIPKNKTEFDNIRYSVQNIK